MNGVADFGDPPVHILGRALHQFNLDDCDIYVLEKRGVAEVPLHRLRKFEHVNFEAGSFI